MKRIVHLAVPAFLAILAGCGGGDANLFAASATPQSPPTLLSHTNTVGDDYNTVVEQLYVAYFGRPADIEGLTNFKTQLATIGAPKDIAGLDTTYNTNPTVKQLIDAFGTSQESVRLYGSGDTTSFVTAIYNNVLNRPPAQSGLDFWVSAIDSGFLTKGRASLSIMAGALANTTDQGRIDAELVTNKITVATNFTHALQNADVYKGPTAAAHARNMLSQVTSTTDVTAFQPTVVSTKENLANPPASPTTPATGGTPTTPSAGTAPPPPV